MWNAQTHRIRKKSASSHRAYVRLLVPIQTKTHTDTHMRDRILIQTYDQTMMNMNIQSKCYDNAFTCIIPISKPPPQHTCCRHFFFFFSFSAQWFELLLNITAFAMINTFMHCHYWHLLYLFSRKSFLLPSWNLPLFFLSSQTVWSV